MEKQIIINSLKEVDGFIEELKKIKIWVCNTACGKSYLCDLDDRFYDLDAYRSLLMKEEKEHFDDLSIPKMEEVLNESKIVLNAAHGHFLKYLDDNNIPFVYMYGKPEVEDEYIERMRHRGSSEEFVQRFGTIVAAHYPNRANDKRGTFKIEMSKNEFVSDYVWKVFGRPEKYIKFNKFEGKDYKIAFVDVDGTLLDREGKVGKKTQTVIENLSHRVKFVLTTSRGISGVVPILQKLKLDSNENLAICFNGNSIIDGTGKVLFETEIEKKDLLLFAKHQKFGSNGYFGLQNSKVYFSEITDMKEFLDQNKIYKIVFACSEKDIDIKPIIKERFNVFKTSKGLLEFVQRETTKERAIEKVLEYVKLDLKQSIAIGDEENDVGMIRNCGCGVAVCNASKKVKDIADYITDSNNDDGVAVALKSIFGG